MAFKTNQEWEMFASEWLGNIATRYLNGETMNRDERAILTAVMAELGTPPEGVPGNDEPIPGMAFELPPSRDEWRVGREFYGNSGTH